MERLVSRFRHVCDAGQSVYDSGSGTPQAAAHLAIVLDSGLDALQKIFVEHRTLVEKGHTTLGTIPRPRVLKAFDDRAPERK